MSIQDPFAIGTPPWLQTDGSDPDHSGDYVRLGRTNVLGDAKKSSDMDPDHIKATFVVNSTPGNATFAAKNLADQGSASLAFGLFGDSDGSVASAGVLGSSACWGVAGVSATISPDLDFPIATGVFGVGDRCGVYGQSTPLTQPPQDPPDDLSKTNRSGVVGVGNNSGVFGIGDQVGVQGINTGTVQGINTGTKVGVLGSSQSGIGVLGLGDAPNSGDNLAGVGVKGVGLLRGGVFQVPPRQDELGEFANVQLTPVATNALKQLQPAQYKLNLTFPDLPQKGKAGDLLVVTVNEIPKDTRGVQLWLCIRSDDPKLAQNATWARVQLENELTVP